MQGEAVAASQQKTNATVFEAAATRLDAAATLSFGGERAAQANGSCGLDPTAAPYYGKQYIRRARRFSAGQLFIVSANVTAWSSMRMEFEANAVWIKDAHVLLLQEMKLAAAEIPAVKRFLMGRGWTAEIAACLKGKAGGRSAGVAVAWRS